MSLHDAWLLKKIRHIATLIKFYKSLLLTTKFLFYFMLAFGLLLLALKFTPLNYKPLIPFVITAIFLLGVFASTFLTKFTPLDCAKYIDKKLNLQEKISTAIETISLKRDTQFAKLQLKQASECLRTADISSVKKLNIPLETTLLPVMTIFFTAFVIIPRPYLIKQSKYQTAFKPQITKIDLAIQQTGYLPEDLSGFIETELKEIKKMLSENPAGAQIRLEKLVSFIKKQMSTNASLTDAHKTTLSHLLSELESTGASVASKLKKMGILPPTYMSISKNTVEEFTFTTLPPAQLPHPATRPSKIDTTRIPAAALNQLPVNVRKEIKKAFVKHNWHPRYDPVLQKYYKFLQEE
jgi:hypothetical protein